MAKQATTNSFDLFYSNVEAFWAFWRVLERRISLAYDTLNLWLGSWKHTYRLSFLLFYRGLSCRFCITGL